MLTQTIPAYAYRQFADDDNVQGLFTGYNQYTQTVIDWFNTINLPIYTQQQGLTLDWVAQGLYGFTRTQLASPVDPSSGMLDTEELNTSILDAYTPSTETFYNLTDDVFQRCLTWNVYKGDGKHFSMRWLKRRIARFFFGANGIDPQPWLPGFTVGAETTTPFGVTVSSGLLTVTIDQTLLSLLAPVTPGLLTLFKAAFLGGYLELPLQYTYAVSIATGFDALAIPSVLTSSTSAFSQTTAVTMVNILGGSGLYTYAWTWQSGGSGITINSPSAVSTSFTASGLTYGQTVTGIARCTVTDTVSSSTALATCEVIITCTAPDSITTEGGLQLWPEGTSIPIIVEP
jgi:hypothetical protein